MNMKEARKIIRKDVGKRWTWLLEPIIKLSDREIVPVTPREMMADMDDFASSREYTPEKHDCDDQTFEELGHCTRKVRKGRGFGWSRKHAFMLFLTTTELWIYDRGFMAPYREAIKINPAAYKLKGRIFSRDLIVI